MEDRRKLLGSLLALDQPLEKIRPKLSLVGWDSEKAQVTLTRRAAVSILRRFLDRELSAGEVEEWAGLVECREDIGFEAPYERTLRDLIYELANPFLTRELSESSAAEWILALESDFRD